MPTQPDAEWLAYMAANDTGVDTIARTDDDGTVRVYEVTVERVA